MQGPNTAPLKHFSTHPNYLKSNSTSHNWVFSAFAELIDNSVDAEATEIHIKATPDKKRLQIFDNGTGMDQSTFNKMLSLGYCDKNDEKVGKYGNGFKSGSMRIGMDAVVFTKCNKSYSCGFLSQSFLLAIGANEVLVPMCTWDMEGNITGDERQADKSLNIINTYSPFETEEDIAAEFSRIKETGTHIYIYNLSTLNDDRSELQLFKDDIKLRERRDDHSLSPSERDPPLRYSLKAYCEVLYLVPRTQIYIQDHKVHQKIITRTLFKTKTSAIRLAGCVECKVTYGFHTNPEMRNINYGVFMYHRNRLIEPLVKVGSMTAPNSVGIGVIGCCEVPYLVPTHNKQGFMQNNLYLRVKRNLAAAFNAFWRMCIPTGGIGTFWKTIKRGIVDDPYLQCHLCYKWRPAAKVDGVAPLETPPSDWCCTDNQVPGQNTCSAVEIKDLVHTNRKIKRREAKGGRKRKQTEEAEISTEEEEEEEEEEIGGRDWVGQRAKSYWDIADGAKWYYATIDDYDPDLHEYKLTYDNGTFAWGTAEMFILAEKLKTTPIPKKEKTTSRPKRKKQRVVKEEEIDVNSEESEEEPVPEVLPPVSHQRVVVKPDLSRSQSHQNDPRQEKLSQACETMKSILKRLDTNGDIDMDKFDTLGIKDLVKSLRNDLNCVLK